MIRFTLVEGRGNGEDHWAVGAIQPEERERARNIAKARLLKDAFEEQLQLAFVEKPTDDDLLERLATAYEIATAEGLDALLYRGHREERQNLADQARAGAYRAFDLRRVFSVPANDLDRVFHILHLASLAYTGDRWVDLRRWLIDHPDVIQTPNAANVPWDERVLFQIYEGWLRLFRKDSWNDLHGIAGIVAGLRGEQQQYERDLLHGVNDRKPDPGSQAGRFVPLGKGDRTTLPFHAPRSTWKHPGRTGSTL
jgi:hypothetical protein